MKKFVSILLVAMLGLSLVACASDSGSSEATENEGEEVVVTVESDAIIIGGLAPLTGGASQYGIAASNGAEVAVKEINDAGGVLGLPIEFIVYDEQGDPTEATNAYNRLVETDGIVALVGDITTPPTIAVAQKAAADGIPMITPTGTGAEITEIGENIFRACFTDPYQGELMANYAFDKLGAKTCAVLYDTGNDYSQGVADAFAETAAELGMEVTAKEGYQSGASDFNAQLTKIKLSEPDVIMAPCYYEDASIIIKQAREIGIESTLLGPDGWDGVLDHMDESNFDALEGAYYCGQYSFDDPSPALENFREMYLDMFDDDDTYINMFAVLGYEAMHLMAAAIEDAGSTDSEAIVEALQNLDWDGVAGKISFQGGNDPARDAYVIQFKDGKEVVLGTYGIGGADDDDAGDAEQDEEKEDAEEETGEEEPAEDAKAADNDDSVSSEAESEVEDDSASEAA